MNKEFLKMQKIAGLITENQVSEMLNKPRYDEFMLEWEAPGEESNTYIEKDLRKLLDYVTNENIKKYTIKGLHQNQWETLIS